MIILKMAWRNIRRNIRRTFGLSVLLFQQSFVKGFQGRLVENSVRHHTGHIQIHKQGYQKQKKVELMIEEHEAVGIDGVLQGMDGVEAYSMRVNFRGLISSAENSGGVQVYGIEPEREKNVTVISQKVNKGEYLSTGDIGSALVGATLAEDLAVGLGDKVVLMTQAVDGSLSAELFRVRGIFESGSPQFDEAVIYVTIGAAQGLLEMGGGVTEFAVLAEDRAAVEPAFAELSARPETRGLEVLSWKEISPHLVQMIELENSGLFIVLAIIFTIVAIGVINTMLMSVMDRIKEFGVMLSLGTRPRHIVTLIIIEAFYLGILGLVFGLTFGFSVVYYFSVHGIDLSSFSDAMSSFIPGEAVIYTTFSPKYTVISSIAVMVTAIVASLYPAFKAARLKPVEALRYI
jgi:ABC-type lipoprotein release transport system permease subunit